MMTYNVVVYYLVLLLVMMIVLNDENGKTFGCINAGEKEALLKFKASLFDPCNSLWSWRNDSSSDCYVDNWKAVRYDNISGHVIELSMPVQTLDCRLRSSTLDPSISKLRHLRWLDMSYDSIDFQLGPIPAFLGSMKRLQRLNLDKANLSGPIPASIGNLSSLTELTLAYNQLRGEIPTSIGNLRSLTKLDLDNNQLSGEIPRSIGNFSSLTYFSLYRNNLSGEIPTSIENLSSLKELDLHSNQLSGEIPTSIGNLSKLTHLSLNDNQLNGDVPTSMGLLSNLVELRLGYNSLNGTLSEAHFANLSKLVFLSTSYNYLLKFRVGFDWVPSFQLGTIDLRSCDVGGGHDHKFPQWLHTQKELGQLFLSNCSISGTLPPEWLKLNTGLIFLDLSHNNISGQIPHEFLPSSIQMLDISHNMISGPLPSNIGYMAPGLGSLLAAQNLINGTVPDSLCELRYLRALDLSKNQLSGNLPNRWLNMKELWVMRLSSNELSGVVPDSLGGATSLMWLHLNKNNFIGKLPSTLKNCTDLQFLDIGDNKFSEELPAWIGKYLLDLRILRLRNNNFHGKIPSEFCQLSLVQVLDLANNMLTGNIPHCFGNFSGMIIRNNTTNRYAPWEDETLSIVIKGLELEFTKTLGFAFSLDLSNNNLVGGIPSELTNFSVLISLNLSHNHLTGRIPGKIGNMKSLESLDLSSNNLFGTIPNSLSDLSSLSHLNLSHNNLSGKIPTGRQLQTLDNPSIFDGNSQLCGRPLLKRCKEDEAVNPPTNDEENDGADKVWFYGVIISGFATGFWVVIGTLVFKRSWRHAYFSFVEERLGRWYIY